MNLKILFLVALAAIALPLHRANAEAVNVSCEGEDVLNAGWNGPLILSYSGGPEGNMSVKSAHIDLTIPASQTERSGEVDGAEVNTISILGSGETMSTMPDSGELLACAARTIQPEFKDDADMQAMALMGCIPQTQPGAAAVKIQATVRVGLLPGDDGVIVEIKRRYVDALTPAGGEVSIETFPKDCKLTIQ